MSAPATLVWFARHEMRLAWRDALAIARGGRRGHGGWIVAATIVFMIVMHLIAYAWMPSSITTARQQDKALLLMMTGTGFLTWTLLLSQAMETVTRGFYTRADLDLILSSPVPVWRLFAVRIAAIAVTTVGMAALFAGPVINVAALRGGPRFLMGYGVLVAMGAAAAAVAVCVTLLLFRVAGPKRTRLLAQIAAAVTGAGFAVSVQAAAILSQGSLSRMAMFQSPEWLAAAPGLASPVWLWARAALGDGAALAGVLIGSFGFLAVTIVFAAPAFARNVLTVAGLPQEAPARPGRDVAFRHRSRAQVLRWKEWTLLWRDPWLVSQSLMQILYLLPAGLMLWHNFDAGNGNLVILAPILVMAAGQLAGGLAWLAISGEDAPDLIASAPVGAAAIERAKIMAVMVVVALPVLPIAGAMAFIDPRAAIASVAGVALAAAGASAIQLIFKAPASRSQFRRRQTSSKFATFAEAFLSISVAAAAGLAAAGLWLFALPPLAIAGGVLLASRGMAPRGP